ncbi:DNA repair and recombination protein pif1 [Cordyceps militaris CM01]|uniref:ATP-dependent DNA helicase PIF1 n=1 Tax=Cordyceps militaris (strain CM01) TaxID=983644 RepID=G3JM88_CORMM|nr:DNA repair and recombination protein pif1 [Cordyceps militaris CM01]EGX90812.1 DNA repair and recombination protein pif1 [Cordyceps militaris CM01]
MLAKANKKYEANRPLPSQFTSKATDLGKQLFPSSSPSHTQSDIRDQLKWRGPPRFLNSSPSTAQSRRPQCKQPDHEPVCYKGTTSGNGAGKGSLASLYRNSSSSFQDNFIDLTGDDNTKTRQPVVEILDGDFSDDSDFDIDLKVPSAIPPSKVTSISNLATSSRPPESSEQEIPWSSSPASHLLPPQKPRNQSNPSGNSGSLKRESLELHDDCVELPAPKKTKPDDDCFETPAPQKAKKRALPSGWQRENVLEEKTLDTEPQTPAEKGQARGLWDPSASTVKELKKQLKSQRSTKQEVSEAEALPAQREPSLAPAPRSGAIALSSEQLHVRDLVVDQGQSVFFTGPAGTGKSVLMRAIIQALDDKHGHGTERVAVTASTGLAACNIGGITLHSFSGIGLGKESATALVKKVRRNPKAKNRWLKTKVLVIDEISMVDGDLFDKLSQIGRTIRNNAPVKFAFDAATWTTSIDHTIGLNQVFRQRDPEFARMLNEMRLGKITDETVRAFKALERPLKFDDGVDSAELFPLRAQVEGSNEKRLRDLPGEIHRFEAADTGDPAVRDRLLANMMAPKSIDLKVGAQVMLIKNLDGSLVNGSVGRVIGFSDEKTFQKNKGIMDDTVEDLATKRARKKLGSFSRDSELTTSWKEYPMVQFPSGSDDRLGRVLLCQPEEWTVELPNGEIQAKRTQLPLILAWALSIHKAQGQTLERVTVNLSRIFEKGQAYVALSRATSQDGLRVLGFDKHKVMAHPKVVEFYDKLYSAAEAGREHRRRPAEDQETRKSNKEQVLGYLGNFHLLPSPRARLRSTDGARESRQSKSAGSPQTTRQLSNSRKLYNPDLIRKSPFNLPPPSTLIA